MKLETRIKSVEAEIQKNKLVLRSKTPLKILSSAVINGGPCDSNCIVNFQEATWMIKFTRKLENSLKKK